MRITESQLRKIIREEIETTQLKEVMMPGIAEIALLKSVAAAVTAIVGMQVTVPMIKDMISSLKNKKTDPESNDLPKEWSE